VFSHSSGFPPIHQRLDNKGFGGLTGCYECVNTLLNVGVTVRHPREDTLRTRPTHVDCGRILIPTSGDVQRSTVITAFYICILPGELIVLQDCTSL